MGLLIISPVKRPLGFYLNPDIHSEFYKGLPVTVVNVGGAGLLSAVFAADESFTLTEDEL